MVLTLKQKHHGIISETEVFSLNYTCPCSEINEISEYLKQQLTERRSEEIARRISCVGPHRDDIEFKINGLDAVKFASQGQQRTLVLSLKLLKTKPVILQFSCLTMFWQNWMKQDKIIY